MSTKSSENAEQGGSAAYKPAESPRFDVKNPGELAKLEATWLTEKTGVKISAAQVRLVHMYHTEFQKSPERLAQREEAAAAREAERAERAAKPKPEKKVPAKKMAPAKKATASKRRAKADTAPAEETSDDSDSDSGTASVSELLPGGKPRRKRAPGRRPARAKTAATVQDF